MLSRKRSRDRFSLSNLATSLVPNKEQMIGETFVEDRAIVRNNVRTYRYEQHRKRRGSGVEAAWKRRTSGVQAAYKRRTSGTYVVYVAALRRSGNARGNNRPSRVPCVLLVPSSSPMHEYRQRYSRHHHRPPNDRFLSLDR
jgi:hypothetical protein